MKFRAFSERALSQIQETQQLAFKEESRSSRLLLQIRKGEVEFGESILFGLYSCITTPRNDLQALSQWTRTKQTPGRRA